MRIIRFDSSSGPKHGVVDGDDVFELKGDLYSDISKGERIAALADVHLLAPVTPRTVICVGNNYNELLVAKGLERPELPNVFLKAVNAVTGPGAELLKPAGIERFEFEGELTLVISKTASHVKAADWRDHVLGFTIGNDMTAREWQQRDTQWWRAKSSDTFCPVGPWIETELDDPENLTLRTLVNGDVKQDSSTKDLTFKLGEVLEIITASITLQPGDIVLTGTPPGFVPLKDGDVVEVEVEGIGTLSNTVRQA